MDDTPKSDSTQANIDDLVKELSRPQNVPPTLASPGTVPVPSKPMMPPPPVMPPKPAMPPPVIPKPTVPSMPPPTMPVKPNLPSSTPVMPAPPKEYQSNIRTMADDLSKLKAGQQPQGVNVPRTVQDQQKLTPKPAPVPVVPPMPSKAPSIQTNLGQTQKTPSMVVPPSMPPKPAMPATPPPVVPPKMGIPKPAPVPTKLPDQKNQFYVPENSAPTGGGINRNLIFIGMGVAVVILGVVYWYFLIRQPNEVAVVSPTPVATAVPTATPVLGLDAIFSAQAGTISLPASGDPTSAFKSALAAQVVNPSSFGVLNVTSSPASGSAQPLSTLGLLDRFLISYPPALRAAVTGDSRVLVFGQDENFDTKGAPVQTTTARIVLVTEVASSSASILQSWEPSMTSALAGLLGFDKTKNTKVFTGDTYQGISIWFKNFPYPDHSIDYALVPFNGNTYWVLASSRESMFAAISAFLSVQ